MADLFVSPRALYMIVCDDVFNDQPRPGKVRIEGLVSRVDWPPGTTVPVRLEKLTILLVLTDGHGTGMGRIVCINEETGLRVFRTKKEVPISFEGKNPLGHFRVTLRLPGCRFPAPGVYSIQFWVEETLVQDQIIIVR